MISTHRHFPTLRKRVVGEDVGAMLGVCALHSYPANVKIPITVNCTVVLTSQAAVVTGRSSARYFDLAAAAYHVMTGPTLTCPDVSLIPRAAVHCSLALISK